MLRVTWVFLLAVAIAGCSSGGGNSVPPAVSAPTATPTATPRPTPTATPTAKPTATPTPGPPTPTPTPTAKPTATPAPTATPSASPTPTATPTATATPPLTNPAGQITFPAGANFPYSLVVTYGPNDAPTNGQTLVTGCATNSITIVNSGQCPTGGAPNASGTVVWIAVTFEPNQTGSVFFGTDPNVSTITGLPAGNYTYVAYNGTTQIASGNVTNVGAQYTYASPFSLFTVTDNAITTIEIIKQ